MRLTCHLPLTSSSDLLLLSSLSPLVVEFEINHINKNINAKSKEVGQRKKVSETGRLPDRTACLRL